MQWVPREIFRQLLTEKAASLTSLMEEINLSIASAQAVNKFLEVVNISLLSPICSARPDLVSRYKDVTLSLVEQNCFVFLDKPTNLI